VNVNFIYFVCVMSTSVFDEKTLLQRVSEGDEAAFRELFYRYADKLGNYVLRLTRSKTQAEEIVQDVFLKIWKNRKALAEVENFSVYLHVVSRNQTLNSLRKTLQQASRQKKWEQDQKTVVAESQPTENETFIDLEKLVGSAIDQLPAQQQKAWLLSRGAGLTHPQIANTMGLSRETVKKYIMYANQSVTRFIRSKFSTSN
jgi:RNA polymerase sigma-70 factor (family 1)